MLARPASTPPASADYLFELKWDGIRALITLDEGELTIRGRNGLDLTAQFPELRESQPALRATSALFDGELVCLDPDGKPNFSHVISRMQQTGCGTVDRAQAKHPAVCHLFDCLYLDGRTIVNEPLTRRRQWLADVIKSGTTYRLSEAFDDGASLFDAVKKMNLEGIMAKRTQSAYVPGQRSDSWLKIKTRQTLECVIIGYTRGQGDRQAAFGALHLAQPGPDGLKYVGKVGTGFDEDALRAIRALLDKLTTTIRPVKDKTIDPAQSVWVKPELMCEVAFASLTNTGLLREPVFVRLRPDYAL